MPTTHIMEGLKWKQKISECKCANCGKKLDVRLSSTGVLFAICQWSDDRGRPCGERRWFSMATSMKMQAAYLAQKQKGAQHGPQSDNKNTDYEDRYWFD